MHIRSPRTVTALAVAGLMLTALDARAPRFYRDDPIARDPETQDAANVREVEVSELYDFAENSFFGAGDKNPIVAVNVNTIGEVPDSSWFTNRLGHSPMSIDQLVKGPDTGSGPVGTWTIVSGKLEGRSPGFTIRDEAGQIYFIKFDPPSNPEMATAAEVISTKFFHAFGYNVPENYLATMTRTAVVIGDGALVNDRRGLRTMEPRDLDELLERAARSADGTYRAVASKALPGKPVGPFRYHGTRPDDPNDIFPHEHRRELRGLLAFCAWLNHDDSRAINTLDTLVPDGKRTIVRHHLLDFGSTLGSGTLQAQSTRAGNEFLWDARPTLITMLTLGFWVRPWLKVPYPEIPSLGRIEAAYFDPEDWKPEYPNTAFSNARPDDLFWAARILSALSDDAVRAVVGTGRYTDAKATAYLTETLINRKRKIVVAWLNGVNPIVEPALSPNGVLTFENAAHKAGVGQMAERYTIQWASFDNQSGTLKDVGAEQSGTEASAQAPAELLAGAPEYIAARLRAFHRDHPAWASPLTVYFRRSGTTWSLVGLER
jgi:hypothetical protein